MTTRRNHNFLENLGPDALAFHKRQAFLSPKKDVLSVEQEQKAKFKEYLKIIEAVSEGFENCVTDTQINSLLEVIQEIIDLHDNNKLSDKHEKILQKNIETKLERMRRSMSQNNLRRFLDDIDKSEGEYAGEFGKMTVKQRIDVAVREAIRYSKLGWLSNDHLQMRKSYANSSKTRLS